MYSSTELTACQSIKSLCQWHSCSSAILSLTLQQVQDINLSTFLLFPSSYRHDGILDLDRPDEHTEKQEDVDHLARAPENDLLVGRIGTIHVIVLSSKDRRRTDLRSRHHGTAVILIGTSKTEYGLNLPKRVESTQFSRRQNLAGQEISHLQTAMDVVQSGQQLKPSPRGQR